MKFISWAFIILGLVILCACFQLELSFYQDMMKNQAKMVVFQALHPYVIGWVLLSLGWIGLLVERLIAAFKPVAR